MGKKYRTGLIILTVILVLVCLAAVWYMLTARAINGFYSVCEDDVFTKTMKVRKLVSAENGNILVAGTFRDGEGVTTGDAVFVKAYRSDGTLAEASKIVAEDGLRPSAFAETGNGLRILFSDKEGKNANARIYNVSADGKLTGSLTAEETAVESDNVRFFLCGEDLWATLKNDSVITVYDEASAALAKLEISTDIEVAGVSVIGDKIYVYGAKNIGGLKGYAEAFTKEGVSLYSLSTMDDKYSVVSDVYAADKSGNIMIFGKFFDDAEYLKIAEESDKENSKILSDIAAESIETQDGLYGEVLFSTNFASSPWCSYFFIEATAEGTVNYVASPFTASSDFGVSELELTKYGDNSGFGVVRMAEKPEDTRYTAYVYPIEDFTKAEASAGIVLPDCVRTYFTVTGDGKIAAYYGIHTVDGVDLLKMRVFESTGEFAAEAKKNAFREKVIEKFAIIEKPAFVFMIFAFLALTATAFLAPDRKENY